MICERILIITLIFGIWCGYLRLQAFSLFYVFLIVELPAKLVLIVITIIIVYLKGILHSLDLYLCNAMQFFFLSSFSFVWDNFLPMLSVIFFSSHTVIAFSNDIPLFFSFSPSSPSLSSGTG